MRQPSDSAEVLSVAPTFYNLPQARTFRFVAMCWNGPCVHVWRMEPRAEVFPSVEEARAMSLLRRIAAAVTILAALTGLAAIAFAGGETTGSPMDDVVSNRGFHQVSMVS